MLTSFHPFAITFSYDAIAIGLHEGVGFAPYLH